MKTIRWRAVLKARHAMHLHETKVFKEKLERMGFIEVDFKELEIRDAVGSRYVMGVDLGRDGGDNTSVIRARVGTSGMEIVSHEQYTPFRMPGGGVVQVPVGLTEKQQVQFFRELSKEYIKGKTPYV